jgi:RNA polymerase sigma-70 factor, ECF subfamily
MSEDAELVARICRGDLNALEALYHKYEGPLYRTALAITGDRGAAEEVLQDCFVRAYGAIERADGSVSLGPWLHRIVANLSYNWMSRTRQPLVAIDELLERLAAGPTASPELMAEGGELRDTVLEAVNSLAVKQRAVVVLYYFQGFSQAEIGYILNCPVGTVKSRLHRACRDLRLRLGQYSQVPEVSFATS